MGFASEHGASMPPRKDRDTDSRAAGKSLRLAIGLPVVLGVALLCGKQIGFYEREFGLALYSTAIIVVFVAFVSHSARASRRHVTEQQTLRRENEDLTELLLARFDAHAQLAEQAEQLHKLADHDALTGLPNRRSLAEHFDRERSRSVRHGHSLSCMMLDIDFFKKINDTHGHAAGDVVLQAAARALKEFSRPSDLVIRYGGEEFCIITPETTEAGAASLAERLRIALAETRIDVEGAQLSVTGSFGVAEYNIDDDLDGLVKKADQALRLAKNSGRNRVICFSSQTGINELTGQDAPANVLFRKTAGELMKPTPCIECRETVAQAVEFLLEHNIGSAPVVDQDGTLAGFISERDLMVLNISPQTWSRPVQEVMKTNVVSYETNTGCDEVFRFLSRVSIHRVVVVEDGHPVGTISPSSLLTYYRQQLATTADDFGPPCRSRAAASPV